MVRRRIIVRVFAGIDLCWGKIIFRLTVIASNPKLIRTGSPGLIKNPFTVRIPFREMIGCAAWIPWTRNTFGEPEWFTTRRGITEILPLLTKASCLPSGDQLTSDLELEPEVMGTSDSLSRVEYDLPPCR